MSIGCLFAAGAVAATDIDIYRYHGLQAIDPVASRDGVYQDFSHDGDNLGKMWSDPDGPLHGSTDSGWVRARVIRSEARPFMRLEFARMGYGVNTGISPLRKIPELIPRDGHLQFEARSSNGACAGLRYMDRDGEIWGYGKAGLRYNRICLPPRSQWTRFRINLTDPALWFKFKYDGNTELGNNRLDAQLLATLSLELGAHSNSHLASGSATLDIRDIRVTAGPASQSAAAVQ